MLFSLLVFVGEDRLRRKLSSMTHDGDADPVGGEMRTVEF